MADKTVAELEAEHAAALEKLNAKHAEDKLKAAPKYPKHIRVECKEGDAGALRDADGKFYYTVEVNSEEEEKSKSKKAALPASAVTNPPAEEEKEEKDDTSTRAGRSGRR